MRRLARELNTLAWPGQDEGYAVYFERLPRASRVAGGMGGGVVYADLWLHPELVQLRLADAVKAVLQGGVESTRSV
jgi:hypothetical protein